MDPLRQLILTLMGLTLLFGCMAVSGLIAGRRILAGLSKHQRRTSMDTFFPLKGRWLRDGLAAFFFSLSLFGFVGLIARFIPMLHQHRY